MFGVSGAVGCLPSPAVLTDRRRQTDGQLLYKVFFFVILVGFVHHLSICVIQSGEHGHGFWSGSRGAWGAWPSLPPETDTFKGSRATRTQNSCGKEVPLHEQDGPSHLGLSGTSHLHPGGQQEHLGSLPGEKGRITGMGTRAGDICWETPPMGASLSPRPPSEVKLAKP